MPAKTEPKRPTELRVGYLPFTVTYLNDEEWAKRTDLSDGDGGQCNGAKAEIVVRLAEDQHDIHVKEILLHETLHACFYASGITVNEDLRVHPDIEESVVARVSPVLLQVMRDNPEFAAYVMS